MMRLGYLYGGKIKGSMDLGTDPYTGDPSTFAAGGLDIDGNADIYSVAGQTLNVEKEGGVNENYWAAKFKATSTDDLALVDKIMSGVIAEVAFTEGSITGPTSVVSGLHAYMQLGQDLTQGAAHVIVAQVHDSSTKTVDSGFALIAGTRAVKSAIALHAGGLLSVLGSEEVAGVIDITEDGESASQAGYLKCLLGIGHGDARYIRLYEAGN